MVILFTILFYFTTSHYLPLPLSLPWLHSSFDNDKLTKRILKGKVEKIVKKWIRAVLYCNVLYCNVLYCTVL